MSVFLPTHWIVNDDNTMTQRGGPSGSYQGLTDMDGRPIRRRQGPVQRGVPHGVPPTRSVSIWTTFLKENRALGLSQEEARKLYSELTPEQRRLYGERAKQYESMYNATPWGSSKHQRLVDEREHERTLSVTPVASQVKRSAPVVAPVPAPVVAARSSFSKTLQALKGDSTSTDVKDDECTLCLANRKTVALVPCGHMCYCVACCHDPTSQIGDTCPICRQEATSAMHIFR